jgi:HAD superfamily hydrolase (TIGR01509 family)
MQWIVFDLDGTLIESEQVWAEVRRRFVTEHRGSWREDAQATMMGMRTADWARYMRDDLGVAVEPEAIARLVVDGVIERLSPHVPVMPGADAALERCSRAFRLGIATSSALRVAKAVLEITGWAKLFAIVVSADSVARGKPAPDVYLRALDLLKADAARTAAVEDSAAGIRSAHAAQLAVVAVPNDAYPPDPAALALATRVIPNLDGLNVAMIRDLR